ncbi:hypothetical protein V494_04456 [Pseudogymnoascus sp. VKM F-4513 (FW-928)]|nr:hypothetical protein V494_04456 [Pseudogymnoascus sp. VKM F-4513 (FW-928)]
MAGMRLFSLCVLLCWFVGISSAAPSGFNFEETSFNDTLDGRSLKEREVFFTCGDPNFSPLLAEAIQDAERIMQNMIDHLELAISLYDEDASGELKADKRTRTQRTFDEHNAIMTYSMVISKIYFGPGNGLNESGLEKLKGTRDLAKTMHSQYSAFIAGQPVRWVRGGFPYLTIYCDDAEVYSERNSRGLTYTEATGNASTKVSNGKTLYWINQRRGVENGGEAWLLRDAVCALQPGTGQTRFGIVPANPNISAYVYPPDKTVIEETMVFCPTKFDEWTTIEASRIASGLHHRNLHVDIGSHPTDAQNAAALRLLAEPDFTTNVPPRSFRWLSDPLVATFIHESAHGFAFTGTGNTLIDVLCKKGTPDEQTTTSPSCLAQVARDLEGHRDAEAFAMYAMATWANAVFWARFKPLGRDTYTD